MYLHIKDYNVIIVIFFKSELTKLKLWHAWVTVQYNRIHVCTNTV